MKRQKVLETAAKLIHGDRAKDYGDAYKNHQRIADGWNILPQRRVRHRLPNRF